jgi:O-acetyl-ADP-ribose deacetylase (regulator of RNase III)
MTLEFVAGDVLDVSSDALLLTIDGAKRGMEGNIARQFARRWPEDWEDMQQDVKYPIPIGRTVVVPWDGDCPWRLIIFASTLHHLDVLNEQQKRNVIRSSLSEALQLCVRYKATSLATVVLQGGWRLSAEAALQEMQSTYRIAGCP